MAIQNPSNLYSGGAVVFNSQPSVNFYTQLLAKQQAKKEALDAYYTKATQDITPAGMRNKDIVEGWAQKASNFQDFFIKNKDRILNPRLDNYQTLTEWNRQKQDLYNDIERSKKESKDEDLLNKARMDGKWNPTDSDIEIANRKGLSIYNKNRLDANGNEPDLTQFSFSVPPFDATKQNAFEKNIQGNLKPEKIYDEKNTRKDVASGMVYVPYNIGFKPEQIKQIADNAGNLFKADKSAQVYYEHLLHDPEFLDNANKAYKSVYGQNASVQTPKQAAQADHIMRYSAPIGSGEDMRADSGLAFQRRLTLQEKQLANSRYLATLRRDYLVGDESQRDAIVQQGFQAFVEDSKKNSSIGGWVPLYPGLDKKYAMPNADGKMIPAEKARISPDGSYVEVENSRGRIAKIPVPQFLEDFRKTFTEKRPATHIITESKTNGSTLNRVTEKIKGIFKSKNTSGRKVVSGKDF